jgi:hypothetical protein
METVTDSEVGMPTNVSESPEDLATLLTKAVVGSSMTGVLTGRLVALGGADRTPLVMFAGQPSSAAVAARSTIDLHGAHIGRQVVLVFDGADPAKPIILGVIRGDGDRSAVHAAGNVDVSADGERMIVTAKEQLVLRCGEASVTLTKAGKVLIQGTHVLSRSSGVNRIKGGSVQLN